MYCFLETATARGDLCRFHRQDGMAGLTFVNIKKTSTAVLSRA